MHSLMHNNSQLCVTVCCLESKAVCRQYWCKRNNSLWHQVGQSVLRVCSCTVHLSNPSSYVLDHKCEGLHSECSRTVTEFGFQTGTFTTINATYHCRLNLHSWLRRLRHTKTDHRHPTLLLHSTTTISQVETPQCRLNSLVVVFVTRTMAVTARS
jgi:hypothetical protein